MEIGDRLESSVVDPNSKASYSNKNVLEKYTKFEKARSAEKDLSDIYNEIRSDNKPHPHSNFEKYKRESKAKKYNIDQDLFGAKTEKNMYLKARHTKKMG